MTVLLVAAAAAAVFVAVAARALIRAADALTASTEAAQADLLADPGTPDTGGAADAGIDWSWLTGHPDMPDHEIPVDRHWPDYPGWARQP